ncbi:MAG: Thiol-disulfide oxidoreductase protein [Deltaproteobacteria bacterium]|nr:Thiol-disulfide oxidoreductase protein [Deltaproteobacteria bacterium]
MKRHVFLLAAIFFAVVPLCLSAGGSTAVTKTTVLNPEAYPPPITQLPMAPRVDTLKGKTLYIIDVRFVFCEPFFEELVDWFAKNMPDVKTVWKQKAGAYGLDDPELWAEVKAKADAAIVAPGH